MLWNKAYETGNATVDSEHKEIFRLVEQIISEDFSTRKEKIETSIDFLADYVKRHFAHEESLMDESSYPKTTEHKGQHSDFAREVVKLRERIVKEGDTLNISLEVNNAVVNWLTKHVLGSDKQLADHYKKWSS